MGRHHCSQPVCAKRVVRKEGEGERETGQLQPSNPLATTGIARDVIRGLSASLFQTYSAEIEGAWGSCHSKRMPAQVTCSDSESEPFRMPPYLQLLQVTS